MADKQDDKLMKKIEEQFILDDTAFKEKGKSKKKAKDTEVKEGTKEASDSEFNKEMDNLGLSKDGLLAIIDDIVTNGAYEEDKSCLGGRVNFKLRSSKIRDSRDFVKSFDPEDIQTQLESEFQFNLATMGVVLVEHNGKPTGDTLQQRMNYIEDNIASPTFQVILKEVFLFGRKMNLIGADEVADFF